MNTPKATLRARGELDRKLDAARMKPIAVRPRAGWARAIRDGLGMPLRVVAERLGVSVSAVHALEKAEAADGITLGKLRELGDALECDLVYALIPRRPLAEVVQEEARRLAAAEIGYVNATMILEGQGLDARTLAEQVQTRAEDLVASGKLWPAG